MRIAPPKAAAQIQRRGQSPGLELARYVPTVLRGAGSKCRSTSSALSEPELVDLNHRIVERLRFLHQIHAHQAVCLNFRSAIV